MAVHHHFSGTRVKAPVDRVGGRRNSLGMVPLPLLTHRLVAAGRFGAAELIDPRPYAVGSIADVLARYPALGHLVPAMGYDPGQMADLRATLEATPADVVLAATPIDLATVLHLEKPVIRVRYDLEYVKNWSLGLDIRILIKTARIVLTDRSAY